jgi:hypothetical protein
MIDWLVEVEDVAPPVEDMRKKMAWMTYSSCCVHREWCDGKGER